jgi:hypothetical protein
MISAFAESMVDKVADGMSVPWNPLSSIYAAFSSNWIFDEDGTLLSQDDNATARVLWIMMKPFVDGIGINNPIDAIYAGFESGKFLLYGTTSVPKRPVYYAHMSDRNHSCTEYGSPCWDNFENVTNSETGETYGPPTSHAKYDCTLRPVSANTLLKSLCVYVFVCFK